MRLEFRGQTVHTLPRLINVSRDDSIREHVGATDKNSSEKTFSGGHLPCLGETREVTQA